MSDEQTQTSGNSGTSPIPATSSGGSTGDGSVIDLRNIAIAAPSAAPSPVLASPEAAATAATIDPEPATPATPVVDPNVAAEFGLDADQLNEIAKKYTIPESVKAQFPDLVALLIKTESMNDEERDYWFQVMPVMNEDQIVKLRTILVNEREQLKKIDEEYDSEMKKLNDVHKNEWNAFEAQQKKAARVQAEATHEEEEKNKEEDLLKRLEEIEKGA